MPFDGLIMRAVANELSSKLIYGKIEKIYQPEGDELIFNIHGKSGKYKLYASAASSHSRVHLIQGSLENPANPLPFCMLLRKHFSGGRILSVNQRDMERILEIEVESMNELGFSVKKRLIIEIMGKHSNIVAVDCESGKIIDCIKRVSIDVNRVRQLLPGKIYEYPPLQNKIPFHKLTLSSLEKICAQAMSVGEENLPLLAPDALGKALLEGVQGISPAIASDIAAASVSAQPLKIDVLNVAEAVYSKILSMNSALETGGALYPTVYINEEGIPADFHVFPLSACEVYYKKLTFQSVSEAVEYYYTNKASSNRVKQKSSDLEKALKQALSKLYLKKQRLCEDIQKAENSDIYRLYGELLTANLHSIKTGDSNAILLNYYNGENVTIPLDVRFSPSKNAQNYFKKYGKAKTALKEKDLQLNEANLDIEYLESVYAFVENASSVEETEELRRELVEGGYLRRRKNVFRTGKTKSTPHRYETSDGYKVLVGRNNRENDDLTFKTAGSRDLWFHTKDIPGSHVILFTEGRSPEELPERAIFEAASLAAYYSKARSSENVPVDYVPVRFVKKPGGAKPGMVIFTNNRTVWTNPALPEGKRDI